MLIGLNGYAGSGKNTVANILKELRPSGVRFVEKSFARALKVSAARALGFSDPEDKCIEICDRLKQGEISMVLDGYDGETYRLSGREFLQYYGTEAHRDVFGSDFWIDQVLPWQTHLAHTESCNLTIITDCRFPNEAYRILQQEGEIWRINRQSVAPVNEHSSEAPLDPVLVTKEIDNNGTLQDLENILMDYIYGYSQLVFDFEDQFLPHVAKGR